MATSTFDELAKALAAGRPRREALKQALTVLGALSGGVTLSLAGAPRAAAQTPAPGEVRPAAHGCRGREVRCGPIIDGVALCCPGGTICSVALAFECIVPAPGDDALKVTHVTGR
jgi:hypothetical protein